MIQNSSLIRTFTITAIVLLVIAFALTGTTTKTVLAQTSTTSAADRTFVAAGDKLYVVTGSQEFVTEVDTSQLPVKYFLKPQTDNIGNIYLLSVASSDRNTQLANHNRQLSMYFTRTEGNTTNWRELKGSDLGLSADSGIYDFSIYTDGSLTILGQTGEVFSGAQDKTTKEYKFKAYSTVMAHNLSISGGDVIPTDAGLVHLLPGGKLAKQEYLSRTIGNINFVLGSNYARFYSFPDPRNLSLPDRNRLTAYTSGGAKSITFEQSILAITPIGAYDYYAIWTDTKVYLIWGDKDNHQSFFGTPTDITSSLDLSGKILSVASYQTGGITTRPSDNISRNVTFYVATDKGIVFRTIINSPTDISVKSLKLLSPTYKIGKATAAIGLGGAFAPTPVDPKEVVPGQPGVIQPAGQSPTASVAGGLTVTIQEEGFIKEAANPTENTTSTSPVVWIFLSLGVLLLVLVVSAVITRNRRSKTHSTTNHLKNG